MNQSCEVQTRLQEWERCSETGKISPPRQSTVGFTVLFHLNSVSIARAGTTPRSHSPQAEPSSRIPPSWATQELNATVKIWRMRRDGKATPGQVAEAVCDHTCMHCHRYICTFLWVCISARVPGMPLLGCALKSNEWLCFSPKAECLSIYCCCSWPITFWFIIPLDLFLYFI